MVRRTMETILVKLIEDYFTGKDILKESAYNKFREIAEEEARII